jgi:hypothetical protein
MRRKPTLARIAGAVVLATAAAGCATVGPDFSSAAAQPCTTANHLASQKNGAVGSKEDS